MNLVENLPFFSVDNHDELLAAIWNLKSDSCNSHLINNTLCFDPFNGGDIDQPPNWSPSDCKYLTTDELHNCTIHPNQFTLTQLNTRSIKKNFESFKSYVDSFKVLPQVITVAETWLKDNEHTFYNLPNYNFISLPRCNQVGGGVGIYLLNNLSFTVKNELMVIMKEVCEYLVLEIFIEPQNSTLVVSLYRPPNTD